MAQFFMPTVNLLLYFGATLIAVSYATVSLQIFIKIIGLKNEMVSIAHNFTSFMNLFNRFTITLSLLVFALAADLGFSDFHLQIALIWFAFFSFFLHGLMFVLKEWISASLEFLLGLYSVRSMPKTKVGYEFAISKTLFLPTFIMVLFLLSFSIPMLFISLFPEFRATILQSSSMINAVGSILNIYFVEKKIAELMDYKDEDGVISYSMSIIYSRIVASFIIFLSFLIFFLVSNR